MPKSPKITSLLFVSDEVDFVQVDKHESFVQIDTMTFDGDGQAFP